MPKAWTGKVVGILHTQDISQGELADKMGVTEAYLSMILKSKREPPNIQKKVFEALDSLVKEKRGDSE